MGLILCSISIFIILPEYAQINENDCAQLKHISFVFVRKMTNEVKLCTFFFAAIEKQLIRMPAY